MLRPYRKKRRHHERDPTQTWESWAVCANEIQEPIVHKADHGLETGLSLRASLRSSEEGGCLRTTEELGPPGEQRAFFNKPGRDTFA